MRKASPLEDELYWLIPGIAALTVAMPFLLGPDALLHGDGYRAYDWLEAAKFRWYVRESLVSGAGLPNWNPYLEGGLPALAHPSDGSISPFFVVHMLFGVLLALKLDAVALLIAGSVGVALLSRSWLRLPPEAAAVAGLGYALAGWSPSRVAVGFYESLWLGVVPLVMHGLVLATRSGWMRGATVLVWTTLLMASAGIQMQLCLAFAAVMLLLWSLLDTELGPRQLSHRVVGMLTATSLLGAVKFLPMLELVRSRAWRAESPVHGVGMFEGILGSLVGLTRIADPVGSYSEDGLPAATEYEYGGLALIILALALLGMTRRGIGRRLGLLALITAGLGWQPGVGFQLSLFEILEPLPIFNSMRDTARYVQYFLLLWCCLSAGLGWLWIRQRLPRRRLRLALLALALLPSAWASMDLHRSTFRHSPAAQPQSAEEFESIELLVRPSGGDYERRLVTWYSQQSGRAVHYRPEDMPNGLARGLRARWHVPIEGPWRRFHLYRGEVFVAEGEGTVSGLRPSPDRFAFEASLPESALVVLNQNHHPDWRVTSPPGVRVLPFEGLLALRFEDGHQGLVQLDFKSRWMRRGFWISLGSLLLLLRLTLLARRRPGNEPA